MLCEDIKNGGDSLYVVMVNRYGSRTLRCGENRSVFVMLEDVTICYNEGGATAPDSSTTTFSYGFNGSHLDKMLFSTIITDANNHSSIELKDVEGKPWAVQASGQPFVYFNYNPVGDNIKVYSLQFTDQ